MPIENYPVSKKENLESNADSNIIQFKQKDLTDPRLENLLEVNKKITDLEEEIDIMKGAVISPESDLKRKRKRKTRKIVKETFKPYNLNDQERSGILSDLNKMEQGLEELLKKRSELESILLLGDTKQDIEHLRNEIYENDENNNETNENKLFQEKSIAFLKELSDTGHDEDYNIEVLSGLDSDRAWKMRDDLLEKGVSKKDILESLSGLDSDRAWGLREDVLKKNKKNLDSLRSVVGSLSGLDSNRAWKMREMLAEDTEDKDPIDRMVLAESITGLSSVDAWSMREDLLSYIDKEGDELALHLSASLAGLDSDRAWKMRDDLLKRGVRKEYVMDSLAGLDTEKAWDMREKLLEEGAMDISMFSSLVGVNTQKAWDIRNETLENNPKYKEQIAKSLVGLDSKEAWDMREKLLEKGAKKEFIARGVYSSKLMEGIKHAKTSDQLVKF